MTEDEMRQAEQHYKIIEESEQNAAGEEEEKKESVPDSSANEEDEPTQLAKRISVGNKRTTSIIESLQQQTTSPGRVSAGSSSPEDSLKVSKSHNEVQTAEAHSEVLGDNDPEAVDGDEEEEEEGPQPDAAFEEVNL